MVAPSFRDRIRRKAHKTDSLNNRRVLIAGMSILVQFMCGKKIEVKIQARTGGETGRHL